MIRRKSAPPKSRPADWLISTEFEGHQAGEEFTFLDHDGQRRRARFIEYVVAPRGDWITCVELTGKDGDTRGVRSIHPHQVRRWWRKKQKSASRRERLKARASETNS